MQCFAGVAKMPSAMSFACPCAPAFQGDLAEVVQLNVKIERKL